MKRCIDFKELRTIVPYSRAHISKRRMHNAMKLLEKLYGKCSFILFACLEELAEFKNPKPNPNIVLAALDRVRLKRKQQAVPWGAIHIFRLLGLCVARPSISFSNCSFRAPVGSFRCWRVLYMRYARCMTFSSTSSYMPRKSRLGGTPKITSQASIVLRLGARTWRSYRLTRVVPENPRRYAMFFCVRAQLLR